MTSKSAEHVAGMSVTRPRTRHKNTIPQAKNRMRRTVDEIIDPGPTNVDSLWEHFEARCAYCEKELSRSDREGHRDHAVPGGGNGVGNLILACARCNGDEKREQPWREFLATKAPDDAAFTEREHRIQAWLDSPPRRVVADTQDIVDMRAELDGLIRLFGDRCAHLKLLVAGRDESENSSAIAFTPPSRQPA